MRCRGRRVLKNPIQNATRHFARILTLNHPPNPRQPSMSLPRIKKALLERCLARQWQLGRRGYASASKPAAASSRAKAAPVRTPTAQSAATSAVKKPTIQSSPASTASTKPKATSGSTAAASSPYRMASKPQAQPKQSPAKVSTNHIRSTPTKKTGSVKSPVESSTAIPISPATSPAATADAVRTAEAREAALRAARLRRAAQREDAEAAMASKNEKQNESERRYKTAARKWVSTIVALPILLVTSYYLFDRCEWLCRRKLTWQLRLSFAVAPWVCVRTLCANPSLRSGSWT